ncbi:hypothetical protein ACO2Q9_20040 [Variovorax sp. VNK109]|uniref:hypothetical protein n=1 Tax=Variovorax sp. VNK109 TaxID=3400919 RepID=UPI003BFB00A2
MKTIHFALMSGSKINKQLLKQIQDAFLTRYKFEPLGIFAQPAAKQAIGPAP